MKMILNIVLAAAVMSTVALPQTAKKTAPPAASAKAKPTLPEGVPAGAEEYQAFHWRWVDKKGVAWIYHQTPFGVVRDQENADDRAVIAAARAKTTTPAIPDSAPGDVDITDKGDSLEFARATPFGKTIWTVKKTELSAEESQLWQKAQQRAEKR